MPKDVILPLPGNSIREKSFYEMPQSNAPGILPMGSYEWPGIAETQSELEAPPPPVPSIFKGG